MFKLAKAKISFAFKIFPFSVHRVSSEVRRDAIPLWKPISGAVFGCEIFDGDVLDFSPSFAIGSCDGKSGVNRKSGLWIFLKLLVHYIINLIARDVNPYLKYR